MLFTGRIGSLSALQGYPNNNVDLIFYCERLGEP